MITNVANSIPPDLKEALQAIGILVFLLATLDNYLLIRYGGKVNRGFTIWKQPLNMGKKSFLEDLKENIVDEKEKRLNRFFTLQGKFTHNQKGLHDHHPIFPPRRHSSLA